MGGTMAGKHLGTETPSWTGEAEHIIAGHTLWVTAQPFFSSQQRQVRRSAFTASSGNLPELKGTKLIYNQSTADLRWHRYFRQSSERVMVCSSFAATYTIPSGHVAP